MSVATVESFFSSSKPLEYDVPLKVIGAGMSRTGTCSFTLALESLLDGPACHSGTELFIHDDFWIRKWVSGPLNPSSSPEQVQSDLKSLLKGYVAVTDIPAILFVAELVQMYPDAKVIVTTREPDRWWESFKVPFYSMLSLWFTVAVMPLPRWRWLRPFMNATIARIRAIYPPGERRGPDLLRRHHDYLRQSVPADRLFFVDVKDGWKPICEILNVPVPDKPFPHVSEREVLRVAFQKVAKEGLWKISVLAIWGGTVCFLAVFLARMFW